MSKTLLFHINKRTRKKAYEQSRRRNAEKPDILSQSDNPATRLYWKYHNSVSFVVQTTSKTGSSSRYLLEFIIARLNGIVNREE